MLDNGDLVSVSNDNTIKISNFVNGNVKKTFDVRSSWSRNIIVFENNCLINANSHNNSINIWDLNDGNIKKTLVGHTGGVIDLKLTKSGDLVSGSGD